VRDRKRWIAVAVGAVAMVVLFVLLRPGGSSKGDKAETVIEVSVAGGTVHGPQRTTVDKDSPVRIIVTSDVADEVHVHGYDLKADVGPGLPGTVQFTATIPGTFEVELEGLGQLLFELEVKP
jgi:heme/copper-type cytochrome/quinol oxidase subunit 2